MSHSTPYTPRACSSRACVAAVAGCLPTDLQDRCLPKPCAGGLLCTHCAEHTTLFQCQTTALCSSLFTAVAHSSRTRLPPPRRCLCTPCQRVGVAPAAAASYCCQAPETRTFTHLSTAVLLSQQTAPHSSPTVPSCCASRQRQRTAPHSALSAADLLSCSWHLHTSQRSMSAITGCCT